MNYSQIYPKQTWVWVFNCLGIWVVGELFANSKKNSFKNTKKNLAFGYRLEYKFKILIQMIFF